MSGESEDLEVGSAWQAWQCKEGWDAYRSGDALYLNWWRAPYGGTERHERNLWVLVAKDFFAEEEESAA